MVVSVSFVLALVLVRHAISDVYRRAYTHWRMCSMPVVNRGSLVTVCACASPQVTGIMGLQVTNEDSVVQLPGYWALTAWAMGVTFYLMRFLTLGSRINSKYRNAPVLLSEQVRVVYMRVRVERSGAVLGGSRLRTS